MLSNAVARPKTDQWKLAAEASWASLQPGCSRTWEFKAEPNVKPSKRSLVRHVLAPKIPPHAQFTSPQRKTQMELRTEGGASGTLMGPFEVLGTVYRSTDEARCPAGDSSEALSLRTHTYTQNHGSHLETPTEVLHPASPLPYWRGAWEEGELRADADVSVDPDNPRFSAPPISPQFSLGNPAGTPH